MRPHVIQLTIVTKYSFSELSRHDVRRIDHAILRPRRRAKHTSNTVSILIVTRESCAELMQRVAPVLDSISAIENWEAVSLGREATAKHPTMSKFIDAFNEAWRDADWFAKSTKAEDLRSVRAIDVFVKHGIEELDRSEAIKMGLRPRGEREAAADADQPQGEATHDPDSLRKQAEALFSPKPVTDDLTPK